MQSIKPADATLRLTHPECDDLFVTEVEFAGRRTLCSLWVPDEQERAAVAAGHPVMVLIAGNTQPPIAISVAANKDRVTDE